MLLPVNHVNSPSDRTFGFNFLSVRVINTMKKQPGEERIYLAYLSPSHPVVEGSSKQEPWRKAAYWLLLYYGQLAFFYGLFQLA